MSVIDRIIDSVVGWRDARRIERWAAAEKVARAKADAGELTDAELVYAATSRCLCGAGMAYPKGIGGRGYWDCSDILTGRASTLVKHEARLPFMFYEIKSENQPSANGATTRRVSTKPAVLASESPDL